MNREEFKILSSNCKYMKYGVDEDRSDVETCRNKENTPEGSSWGDCHYDLCPLIRK